LLPHERVWHLMHHLGIRRQKRRRKGREPVSNTSRSGDTMRIRSEEEKRKKQKGKENNVNQPRWCSDDCCSDLAASHTLLFPMDAQTGHSTAPKDRGGDEIT
jgi:hypothetical protein